MYCYVDEAKTSLKGREITYPYFFFWDEDSEERYTTQALDTLNILSLNTEYERATH